MIAASSKREVAWLGRGRIMTLNTGRRLETVSMACLPNDDSLIHSNIRFDRLVGSTCRLAAYL